MQQPDRRQFQLFGAAAAAATLLGADATARRSATGAATVRDARTDGRTPRVAFVLGDHEYSSEVVLPVFAAEFGRAFGIDTVVLRSFPDQNAEEDIPGLEWLEACDAAVFYLRWRRLPAAQLARIGAFLERGKGVVGLRTTTHAFRYDEGDARAPWNAFAQEAFGAPPGWGAGGHTHYGHSSRTAVAPVDGSRHEILRGVGAFDARSWLYRVLPHYPVAGAERLVMGTSIEPEHGPAEPNPVAWSWTNKWKGRAFFTTLGHPEDFQAASMQRLLANGILWSLGQQVPDQWNGPWAVAAPYRGQVESVPRAEGGR